MEIKIAKIEYSAIVQFKARCARERVSIEDTANTEYFAAKNKRGEVVGFTGIMFSGATARMKSHYVSPNYRGNGIFTELWNRSINEIQGRKGIRKITAFCTKMSLPIYMANGFSSVSERNGITFVERNI